MHTFFRLIGRFRRDRRGNIAVIFAVACVPLISAIGCAVDYTRAVTIRSKLQSAIDAASVGSVARLSPGSAAAATMSSNGPIQAGVDDATKIFNGNVSGMTGYTLNSFTPSVTKSGVTIVSDMRFSADVPTMFLGVIGKSKMTVTGDSGAVNSLPPYLDFYLMLDVSGSMGLPSTNAEQTRLSLISPDMFTQYPGGCTLACHFTVSNSCANSSQKYPTNNECLGYWISRVSPTAYANLVSSTTAWNAAGTAQSVEAGSWLAGFDDFRPAGFIEFRRPQQAAGGFILRRRRHRPTASSCAPTRSATP